MLVWGQSSDHFLKQNWDQLILFWGWGKDSFTQLVLVMGYQTISWTGSQRIQTRCNFGGPFGCKAIASSCVLAPLTKVANRFILLTEEILRHFVGSWNPIIFKVSYIQTVVVWDFWTINSIWDDLKFVDHPNIEEYINIFTCVNLKLGGSGNSFATGNSVDYCTWPWIKAKLWFHQYLDPQ